MTLERMNAVLMEARPDELPTLLEYLWLFEMPEDEADEWRRRIVALQRFHDLADEPDTAGLI